MTYEKYKAFIYNNDFRGRYWWVTEHLNDINKRFVYRLKSNPKFEYFFDGQYILVSYGEKKIEIGKFFCSKSNGNYYKNLSYVQCDMHCTKLIRIGIKYWNTVEDMITAIDSKESLISGIFGKAYTAKTLSNGTEFYEFFYPIKKSEFYEFLYPTKKQSRI